MNCYEIELMLYGRYERPLDNRPYMDPSHVGVTVNQEFECRVCVWAGTEDRAKEIAAQHDYDCDDYDVLRAKVVRSELACSEEDQTEEELEITYQEGL